MSFSDFVHKYNFKNKATSNIKIQQVLGYIGIDNVAIFLKDGTFSSDNEFLNLNPYYKGAQLVAYINGNVFGSYGCQPPNELCKSIIKQNIVCIRNTKYKD